MSGQGERTPVLEQLAQQMAAGIAARVGRGWRWRAAAMVGLGGR